MKFGQAKQIVAKLQNGEQVELYVQVIKGKKTQKVTVDSFEMYDSKTILFFYNENGIVTSSFHNYFFEDEDGAGVRKTTNAKYRAYSNKW